MLNQVLWVLDNETDPKKFERLCVDLLFRNGYRNIVPIGGVHDRGRDAEARRAKGIDKVGELTFFQFSLQKTWKKKLFAELRKVAEKGHEISSFVFLTNQTVSGRDIDRLKDKIAKEYGWELKILSREWLRLQLEEAHPDLAQRHLGVQLPQPRHSFVRIFRFHKPEGGDPNKAWEHFENGDFERAAIELKAYLRKNPGSAKAWKALAWSQYQVFRYEEALASINKALEINPIDNQAVVIRGCVLAEYGIRRNSRASIMEANKIFKIMLGKIDNWTSYYNYANTLGALGKHKEAITQYLRAIEREPNDPRVWKNLASAFHQIGAHDEEMRCFDRALELDPDHSIALMSKGVSILTDFKRPAEAVQLMEQAFEVHPDIAIRWPHTWYWLGEAYRRMGNLTRALKWVDAGLKHSPGHSGLRVLKFSILSNLWKENRERIGEATDYFEAIVLQSPLDYSSRRELVKLYEVQGRLDEAWNTLQSSFNVLDMNVITPLQDSAFSLEECNAALRFLPFYRSFRRRFSVADYWDVSDPLYGIDAVPKKNTKFEDAVYVFSAIPFGLGYAMLGDTAPKHRTESVLLSFFDKVRSGLEKCIPRAARRLANWIPAEADTETIAQRLSEMVVFVPLVALREFGRQRGWISALLEIPNEMLTKVMENYDEGRIEKKVAVESLRQINEVRQIFPNDVEK